MTLSTMAHTLTDITVLMIFGCLPDYLQGITKLSWVVGGWTRIEVGATSAIRCHHSL